MQFIAAEPHSRTQQVSQKSASPGDAEQSNHFQVDAELLIKDLRRSLRRRVPKPLAAEGDSQGSPAGQHTPSSVALAFGWMDCSVNLITSTQTWRKFFSKVQKSRKMDQALRKLKKLPLQWQLNVLIYFSRVIRTLSCAAAGPQLPWNWKLPQLQNPFQRFEEAAPEPQPTAAAAAAANATSQAAARPDAKAVRADGTAVCAQPTGKAPSASAQESRPSLGLPWLNSNRQVAESAGGQVQLPNKELSHGAAGAPWRLPRAEGGRSAVDGEKQTSRPRAEGPCPASSQAWEAGVRPALLWARVGRPSSATSAAPTAADKAQKARPHAHPGWQLPRLWNPFEGFGRRVAPDGV
jgi:hypothetical protein